MLSYRILIGAVLVSMSAFSPVFSQELTSIEIAPSGFRLEPGERKLISLNSWHGVKKLEIRADGIGGEALFEVRLNGDVKGTVHVPGYDPEYVVTVNEAAKEFEFVHRSGRAVRVQSVMAYLSEDTVDFPDGYPLSEAARSVAVILARNTIATIEKLGLETNQADFENYLLPIKIAAGRAYAYARANGDLSRRVRTSLEALLASLILANPYTDLALADAKRFNLAVELLAIRHRLENLLN